MDVNEELISLREELAWMAGFFDGEGCVGVQAKRGGYHRLFASVSQCVREPLELFVDHFGNRIAVGSRAGHVDVYKYNIQGKRAGRMLEALYPYLIVKARVAKWGLLVARTIGEDNS